MAKKTAILIYCTREEREMIKLAAKRERRTITGFAMNAITSRFAVEGRIQERKQQPRVSGNNIASNQNPVDQRPKREGA